MTSRSCQPFAAAAARALLVGLLVGINVVAAPVVTAEPATPAAQNAPGGAVTALPGHMPSQLANAVQVQSVDAGRVLQISISLNPRNLDQLKALTQDMANP